MDPEMMLSLGHAGAAAVIGLAAIGSALGTGSAGLAAVGAWKRCYALEKPVPFILVTFVGAPLSQTIYGMILMNAMVRAAGEQFAAGERRRLASDAGRSGSSGAAPWRRPPGCRDAWGPRLRTRSARPVRGSATT